MRFIQLMVYCEEIMRLTEQIIVTTTTHREYPVLRGQPVYFARAHSKRER